MSKLSQTLTKEPGGLFSCLSASLSSPSPPPRPPPPACQPRKKKQAGKGVIGLEAWNLELAPGGTKHSKAKHPIRFLTTRLFFPAILPWLPCLIDLDCPPQLLPSPLLLTSRSCRWLEEATPSWLPAYRPAGVVVDRVRQANSHGKLASVFHHSTSAGSATGRWGRWARR